MCVCGPALCGAQDWGGERLLMDGELGTPQHNSGLHGTKIKQREDDKLLLGDVGAEGQEGQNYLK